MQSARAIFGAVFTLSAGALVGCGSGPSIETSQRYVGPPLQIERGAETYVAVFTAPTGGWNARLDLIRKRFELQEAFITLTRPPTDAFVPLGEVVHNVETRVNLTVDLSVYVRLVDYGSTKSDRSYRLAGGTIEVLEPELDFSVDSESDSP